MSVKVVEFCAETRTSTVEIQVTPALGLAEAKQALELVNYRVMAVGNACLLARANRRLIHVYASGKMLVNLADDMMSGVRLLAALLSLGIAPSCDGCTELSLTGGGELC